MLKQLFDFLNILKFDIESRINNPVTVEIKTGPFGMMVLSVEFMYKKKTHSVSVIIEKCEFDLWNHERDYILSLQKIILNKVRKETE